MAYPIIPVSIKEPVIFIVKLIKPRGLIIGPIYLNQLPLFILSTMNSISGIPSQKLMSDIIDTVDPCYAEYQQYGSQYSNGKSTLIWAAPMFVGVSDAGIQGYVDDNGTLYWDTCLAVGNSIYKVQLPGYSPTYYLPVQVLGYENYYESSIMYNNGGLEDQQMGTIDYYTGYQQYSSGATAFIGDPGGGAFNQNEWNPPSTSSTSSYTVSFGVSMAGIPSVSVGISLPSGTSESISGSLNPAKTISFNGWTVEVSNITWTYNIGHGADQKNFPSSFEDITPANIYLSSLASNNVAEFNVDFENYAITASYTCLYYTTETIWIDTQWIVNVEPQSSTTANVTGYGGLYSSLQSPPGSYVTGVTSSEIPWICYHT